MPLSNRHRTSHVTRHTSQVTHHLRVCLLGICVTSCRHRPDLLLLPLLLLLLLLMLLLLLLMGWRGPGRTGLGVRL